MRCFGNGDFVNMCVYVYMCLCVSQEATEGRGVDVIVEMLSNVNLSKDLQMMAYGGRVVVSGGSQMQQLDMNKMK